MSCDQGSYYYLGKQEMASMNRREGYRDEETIWLVSKSPSSYVNIHSP
jgi:hypothetical protein